MSTLVLLLPPRARLRAQGADAPAAAQATTEYSYLLTPDGVSVIDQGRTTANRLPRAETVIAVPAESDLSWHQVALPKTGRARMRAALAGMLEEVLLEDPEQLHFALETDAAGGDRSWVVVMSKAWLADHLAALEAAHVFVDRVAPMAWPESPPVGHFYEIEAAEDGLNPRLGLRWSHPQGVANMGLDGTLVRKLFPDAAVQAARWTATPGAADAAGRWLGGAKVSVLTPTLRSLGALDSPWNLRQFDLAPRARGVRAFRQAWRTYMRRAWRPVRLGLLGLAAVHLIGLNFWALHQRKGIESRKAAAEQVLRSTHPQVRAVLDARVQMERETDLLRIAAGRPGEDDLESLLGAAATAWPVDMGPLESLRFEPGRLTLSAGGWRNDQVDAFRSALRSEGWQLEVSENRMTVSRVRREGAATAGGRS
ncbi:MAG: general secretion pathway protein GspL [Burkholderiaceae bacterium]|nr:general secretion pathway protein GspL [Burkholderiaceae bacterium]